MEQTEITAAIRRGIFEPSPRTVTDTQITSVTLRGVTVLGLKIKEVDNSFFTKRAAISSYTNIFEWPSDCQGIIKVYDLGTTAGIITDATNASPIVITEATHGRSDDDIVTISGVGGNTAANGTFQITYVDADSYSLNGSTGNAAYTSGGLVFEETGNFTQIRKIALSESTGECDEKWYPMRKRIVVDDPDFTDDIIIYYLFSPTAITDIPSEYHEALVSFGVINLLQMPKEGESDYQPKKKSFDYHMEMWQMINSEIETGLDASSEPSYIKNVWGD